IREWSGPRSACAAIPSSFDTERLAGVAVLDILAVLHPHPRDGYLHFRDADHSYKWQNKGSAGHEWWSQLARLDYVAVHKIPELRRALGSDGPPEAALQHLLTSLVVDLEAVCCRLRDLIWTHPGYGHLASIVSLTDAEILDKWERNRRTAAAEGTWMHAMCECLLNGGSVPMASAEICMFMKFLKNLQAEGWIIHRTEWAIYAEAEDLAGSIDAVARRPSSCPAKTPASDADYAFLFEDIPDAMLWHYRIQLNIYAWILRHYYDLIATDLRIVCLHPDNGLAAYVVPVPLMLEHMNKLMSWRRDDLQSCIGLTKGQVDDLQAGCGECFLPQANGQPTHRMLDQGGNRAETTKPEDQHVISKQEVRRIHRSLSDARGGNGYDGSGKRNC
ncbi:unnamed protein product, partial [Symbiodinium sp. CCMP2456]